MASRPPAGAALYGREGRCTRYVFVRTWFARSSLSVGEASPRRSPRGTDRERAGCPIRRRCTPCTSSAARGC
jgi:hypothetical protein